jgi:hypothetical protein
MFRRRREDDRRGDGPSDGPVDVAGVRAVIAEALATLPPVAAEVTEVQVPKAPDPGLPEHLEMRVMPRAAGAVDITIHVYKQLGQLDIFVGNSPPIELTAPINLNQTPPRPFLGVVREVIEDVMAGKVDMGAFPGSRYPLIGFPRWGGRDSNYGYPRKLRITWSAAAP